MSERKVYVGQIRSHLGDRITVYDVIDADGEQRGTETIMEAEFDHASDNGPLVLALDEPVADGLIYT